MKKLLFIFLLLCATPVYGNDFFKEFDKQNKEHLESLYVPFLCECDRRKVDTKWVDWLKRKKDDLKAWVDESYENDAIAYMIKRYSETGGNIWERSEAIAGGQKIGIAVGKTNTYNRAIEREFTPYLFWTNDEWTFVFSHETVMLGYHHRFGKKEDLNFLENEVETEL